MRREIDLADGFFVPLNQAKVRQEARRAVDRLRCDELGDIAYSAAKDFIRPGYPGVSTDCDDPLDYSYECHYATIDAAKTAAEAAYPSPSRPPTRETLR